jgi:KDO2-lipid IV(A) lauroyltransferase
MQYKIARPSRISDRFNRWAIRRGFPALAWIAPRAPRWFLHAGARLVISVVMALHSKPKAAIARNLARITGAGAGSRAVARATRRMLFHLAYYWVDLFRFAQLPADRLLRLVVDADAASLAPVQRAREAGERVILMTAHLGNWELGAVLAGQSGLPVSVVYVPDEFGEAEHFRSLLRSFGRLEEIPIHPEERFASLPVLRAFSEGRVIALQGDRDFNDRGVRLPFFGAPASFPAGPFHLARMTGARLWPVFIAYAPDKRFEIELGEPIAVERTADREGDIRRALERWIAVLERGVARWPDQWYTFFDFWPAGPAAPGPEGA